MRLPVRAVVAAVSLLLAGQLGGARGAAGTEPQSASPPSPEAVTFCGPNEGAPLEPEAITACFTGDLPVAPSSVKQPDPADGSAVYVASVSQPQVDFLPAAVTASVEGAVNAASLEGPLALVLVPPYQVEDNHDVRRFLDEFQNGYRRAVVERWLTRAGRYLPMILDVFKQKGLPEDLVFTAMIESGFDPLAVSRAGAKGLWQFMAPTARRYGLRIDNWPDELLDPEN